MRFSSLPVVQHRLRGLGWRSGATNSASAVRCGGRAALRGRGDRRIL